MSAGSSLKAPRQVTAASHGHILTNTAVWSPDGQWIVYDVRSDLSGSTFDGTRIERVHVASGRVEVLYESREGACCGVATYHPTREEVVFILGPERPTPDWAYSACHRRGVTVDAGVPGVARNLDARDLVPPFTPGALRGGSHVHVYSADGKFVSFTYDDHVLEQSATLLSRRVTPSGGSKTRTAWRSGCENGTDVNQRNVGVSLVGVPVAVTKSHPRNHDGTAYSVLVTKTANNPVPGSDEIGRAYEDAWIGTSGYVRGDGSRQPYALAFLGDVSIKSLFKNPSPSPSPEYWGGGFRIGSEANVTVTELFVVDLPDDITVAGAEPLEGSVTRRPAPPRGTNQRRITFTADRKHPGVQGPRHWPRSSADGSRIAFLMRDEVGHAQLWTISPLGTELRQVTSYPFDVASAFSWHPGGMYVAHVADDSVWIVNTDTGESRRVTAAEVGLSPRPEACVFSPDGSQIAYVQPVVCDGATWNQIFVVESGES
jgi:hypothetical protein